MPLARLDASSLHVFHAHTLARQEGVRIAVASTLSIVPTTASRPLHSFVEVVPDSRG